MNIEENERVVLVRTLLLNVLFLMKPLDGPSIPVPIPRLVVSPQ